MPWVRPGARHTKHTKDFEDVVAWLAQRTDKTTITRLLRCSWESVATIVVRVVAEAMNDARLEALYRIGVDEIAYRSQHRYITVVADHDRDGAVVWAKEGKDAIQLVDVEMGQPSPARGPGAAQGPVRHPVPRLPDQGGPARRLPSRPSRRPRPSRRLAGVGLPEPHPRNGPALPDDPSPPQGHRRCRATTPSGQHQDFMPRGWPPRSWRL